MSARTRGINPITIKDVLFKKLAKSKALIEQKILRVSLEKNKVFKIMIKNHSAHLHRVWILDGRIADGLYRGFS